jgi:hypothetical protein
MNGIQIKIVVALVFAATAVVLVIQRQPPSIGYWRPFSTVATIVAVLLLLWDRYMWAWPIVSLLAKRPNIRGTWKGTLQSDWKDPQTNERHKPAEIYLVIRQTYSTLWVRLLSNESSSDSLSANLSTDSADIHTLAVTYINTPNALILGRSPISHGGMLLSVGGSSRVHQLEGKYWTDRKTLGEITLSQRVAHICYDFKEASQAFDKGAAASARS